jgi:hypothetical protein
MNDLLQAKVRCLQNNLARYCRLLATELTDVEREFIHTRIAHERTALEMLLQSKRSGGLQARASHHNVEAERRPAETMTRSKLSAQNSHVL